LTCDVQPSDDVGGADDALAIAAEAWLPTSDPATRAHILGILRHVAKTEADPIAALRDGLDRWFGLRASVALSFKRNPSLELASSSMVLEPLSTLRQPTLWPQRPKRLPDELFSSWLWRAAIAAGVPPRTFAKEVLRQPCEDADRDVGLGTLRRLAQLTGQTAGHLAGGLLQLMPEAAHDTQAGLAENVLLADETFLLTRRGRDRLGRPRMALQYCPRCLGSDLRPHFRRAWRLAHSAICLEHGCRLHDRCWRCKKPVVLLDHRATDVNPCCHWCEARLAEAPSVPGRAKRRQAALHEMLLYVGIRVPANARTHHLDRLRQRFGSAITGPVEEREAVLATLFPASMALWFGRAADKRHAEELQMLAESISYDGLRNSVPQQTRRARRAKRAASEIALPPEMTRRIKLADYSDMARTLTRKIVDGQRELAADGTPHYRGERPAGPQD
jgi:hypothetical protein